MLRNSKCRRVAPLLWDQAYGRLQASEQEQVEAHLQRCAACRQEAASYAQTARLLAADRAETVPVPSPLWQEVESGLNAAQRRRPAVRWAAWTVAWGMAALAALLLLWLAHHPSGKPSRIAPYPDPRKSEAIAVHKSPGKPMTIHAPTHEGAVKDNMPPHDIPNRLAIRPPHASGPERAYASERSLSGPGRSSVGSAQSATPIPSGVATRPDADYLDGRDSGLASFWAGQRTDGDQTDAFPDRSLAGLRDDFIRVPFPALAGTNPASVAAARRVQQEQAKIVDARLFRRVTLALKGVSLETLCALLQQQTGVILHVSRGIRDEKTTIFVKDLPARDLMRGVARLFGYYWSRTGEEGAYQYELAQDLRARLVEEELRSRDLNAALIRLDDAMRQRAAATSLQKDPYYWPIYQLYERLSSADRAALRNGEALLFRSDSENPDRRIPGDLRQDLLRGIGTYKVLPSGETSDDPNAKGTPVANLPGAACAVKFQLGHTELGHITLQMTTSLSYPLPDGRRAGGGDEEAWGNPLVSAQSLATEHPDNNHANAALRQDPALQRIVSLRPEPSCPRLQKGQPTEDPQEFGATATEVEVAQRLIPMPHVTSADVWEEVHRQTGLPIIADYYTRIYPASAVTVTNTPLFDALCHVMDALGARWKLDGGLLLGRSASYYWDKQKEPPNALLDRLQSYRRGGMDLPLEELLQMARLSDAQLDSENVAQGVRHCREVDEWSLVSANSEGWRDFYAMRRAVLRALSSCSAEQWESLQSPNGLAFSALGQGQQQEMSAALRPVNFWPALMLKSRIRLEYVPYGRYVWLPRRALAPHDDGERLPLITGRTREETLAAARRVDAQATDANITRTRGILAISLFINDGISPEWTWSFGRPLPR